MDRRPSRSPVNVRPVTRENVPSHRRKVLFLKCRVTVPVFDLLLSVSSPVLQINHMSTVISEFFVFAVSYLSAKWSSRYEKGGEIYFFQRRTVSRVFMRYPLLHVNQSNVSSLFFFFFFRKIITNRGPCRRVLKREIIYKLYNYI